MAQSTSKINTFSTSSFPSSPDRAKLAGSSFSTAGRSKRRQDVDSNQSIYLSSPNGLQIPSILRAAQAGSGAEIQAQLSNGGDVEAHHISTGRTALSITAHCGNAKLVDLLLKYNAKVATRANVQLCTQLPSGETSGCQSCYFAVVPTWRLGTINF